MKKISKRFIISAGIVPVKLVDGKYHFLLLRSGDHWDFPKGKSEPGEKHLLETALRETAEETELTVNDLDFKWGTQSKKSDVYKKGTKFAVYYIAESNKDEITLPISEELGRPEHDEYTWVTYEEAAELVGNRIKKILDWANDIVNG